MSVWRARRGCVGRQGFKTVVYRIGMWYVWPRPAHGEKCRLLTRLRPVQAVFCIGSALQTWARSLTQITAGRAIGGLGVGALRYSLTRFLDVRVQNV